MIDPITAITAATTAYKTVQRFVAAGQDFKDREAATTPTQ